MYAAGTYEGITSMQCVSDCANKEDLRAAAAALSCSCESGEGKTVARIVALQMEEEEAMPALMDGGGQQ